MTNQNTSPSANRPLDDRSRPSDAYRAVREAASGAAAVFSRRDRSWFRVTGPDRHSWLQGLVTNDVAGLEAGRGRYAAYLTPQGRMITDMRVLAVADALLIEVPARTATQVLERLQSFIIMEDVTIEDVTADVDAVSVHGRESAATTAAAVNQVQAGGVQSTATAVHLDSSVLASLDEIAFVTSGDLRVIASNELGKAGFDIEGTTASVARFRSALLSAGAVEGDDETWDVLRIEAGTPVFGRDMDETTIPLEAGIEGRAISFTKGCYVGQEVIIRVVHRGHGRVARRLVGLRVEGGTPAHTGVLVGDGDSLFDVTGAREIGRTTSTAFSPLLQATIALAYVQRDFAEPGTELRAMHEGVARAAVVVALPFVHS